MTAAKQASKSEDPAVAISAISVVRHRYGRDAALAFLEGVGSGKFSRENLRASTDRKAVDLMRTVSLGLRRIDDSSLAPALRELLNKPDLDQLYVEDVVTALSHLGDIRALPSIVKLLESDEHETKLKAVRSLETLTRKAGLTDAGTRVPDVNQDALDESVSAWLAWWETAGRNAYEEEVRTPR